MKQTLINFNGDPNVGLYGFCNEKVLLVPRFLDEDKTKTVKETLNLESRVMTIMGTDLLGIFIAGNSNGIIIPDEAKDEEIDKLKELGLNVCVLSGTHNTFGNLIVANDNGAFISELIADQKDEIQEALQVPVEVGKIANLDIVGSVAVATNHGCLVHPSTTEEDAQKLEKILKVPIDLGTVNFGSPFVSSGIIANSNGVIMGAPTSGPEITRIIETLYE